VITELPDARRLRRHDSAEAHLRAFIRAQRDELNAYDRVVGVSDDSEPVHRMRVAVRRLRSVLRTARPMLERGWVDDLRAELDLLGKALGAVRDLDVLIEHLEAEGRTLGPDAGAAEGLLGPLGSARLSARAELRAALDSERYPVLLDRLESAARSLPLTRSDLTVEDLAKKEFEKLLKFEKRASDDDRQLHELRIRGKRARYAAELAERSRGTEATRFVKASERLQDTLGEHQDAVVASGRLRRLAWTADSHGAFTAGRLAERESQRKLRVREELPSVWKRVEKRGRTAW
jgi:CHAD domain-containing protein